MVDERLILDPGGPDTSPRLEIWGEFPGLRLEFVVYTELGYEPALWREAGPGVDVDDGPFGPGQRLRVATLWQVLTSRGVQPLFVALAQAEDLGARTAWLEIRAVDDARGVRHRPVAASRWIRLAVEPGLAALLYPR